MLKNVPKTCVSLGSAAGQVFSSEFVQAFVFASGFVTPESGRQSGRQGSGHRQPCCQGEGAAAPPPTSSQSSVEEVPFPRLVHGLL